MCYCPPRSVNRLHFQAVESHDRRALSQMCHSRTQPVTNKLLHSSSLWAACMTAQSKLHRQKKEAVTVKRQK